MSQLTVRLRVSSWRLLFRSNRDDLAISDDSDADLIDLPKSPAELELNSEKAK